MLDTDGGIGCTHPMKHQDPSLQSQVQGPTSRGVPAIFLLLVATWFGIFTGLLEGLGLLLFQRINWRQWALMTHVSKEILWVSPIVDLIFFLLVALAICLLSRFVRRLPTIRVLVFLLTFLAAYDLLALTERLYLPARLLLSLGVALTLVRWLGTHEPGTVRFWRRSWRYLVALLLIVFVGIQGGKWLHERTLEARLPPALPGSPNVLVVIVDTLRADHLSAYGYSRPTSPQMDAIARQGVLFENAIAPCSWTLPSHASLLTGRYPREHGLGNVQPMPWLGWDSTGLNGYPTLGEALQQHGYRTGAFSANGMYFSDDVGLGSGFIHFEDYFFSAGDSLTRTVYGRRFAGYRTRALRYLGLGSWLDPDSEESGGVRKRASDVNQEVLRWIEHDQKRPFFAFLNYLDVHSKYGVPLDYPRPLWDQGRPIDEYDAGLTYVDDYIGRLRSELERLGRAQNMIVVITSDHGESLGDHGLTFHGAALYWELIHVPLIISYPGHVPAGLRLSAPVSNAAIPATILDLLGTRDQKKFPGPALSALWQVSGRGKKWLDPLAELAQTDIVVREDRAVEGKVPIATTGSMKTLITQRWQLIVHQKLGVQLYDRTNDPGETHDLVQTPEARGIVSGLLLELEARSKD